MPRPISTRLCQECRRRKQKCDERRPSCSLCLKMGVHCAYPHVERFISIYVPEHHGSVRAPEERKDVKLGLRRSYQIGDTGLYQILTGSAKGSRAKNNIKKEKSPDPWRLSIREPSPSKIDLTACELISLLSADDATATCFWMLGDWPLHIPSHIGISPALDAAVQCLFSVFRANRTLDENDRRMALKCYGKAVGLIREAVNIGPSAINAELIAAMKLFETFEITVAASRTGYAAHAFGAVTCFAVKGPEFCKGDFERSLFHATYGAAANQTQNASVQNIFETPEWQNVAPAPAPLATKNMDTASKRRRVVTLVPRLNGFVRALVSNPHNRDLLPQVTAILSEVLTIDWAAPSAIPKDASISFLSHSSDSASPLIATIEHSTEQSALAHINKCSTKIVTSGLCQQLYSLNILTHILPPLQTLHDEDLRCATQTCMSLSLFFNTTPEGTMLTVGHMAGVLILPLQTCWGALWRVKRRAEVLGKWEEVEMAWNLMRWLEERVRVVARALGHEVQEVERYLMVFMETIQGGKLDVWEGPGEERGDIGGWEEDIPLRNEKGL